jgi:hypothetical protein
LIQKCQISVFGKCLDFVEFEYVLNLDSNSNLLKRKFEKLFYFPLAARNQYRPTSHWQPSSVPFISFVFISVPAQSPSAFRPVTGSIPSSFSSFDRTTTLGWNRRATCFGSPARLPHLLCSSYDRRSSPPHLLRKQRTPDVKDWRRRPERGEWKSIKISRGNLIYVPNRPNTSLL